MLSRRKFYKGHNNLKNAQLETIKGTLERRWRRVMLDNRVSISLRDFISMFKERYESDKTTFTKMIIKVESTAVKAIDSNCDNMISKEEFIKDMDSSGRMDMANNSRFFFSFPGINGCVPVEVLLSSLVRFLTEDDQTKPDSIKTFLDSDIK
jgi:predicted nucleic-acid-binding protein